MSLSPEALQQLFLEIEEKASTSQKAILNTREQIAFNQRDKKLSELTLKEINSLPENTRLWESAGKSFSLIKKSDFEKGEKKKQDDLQDQIAALKKKLHYHETTFINAKKGIESLMEKK